MPACCLLRSRRLPAPHCGAVNVIAARMAEQRERSGLFFAWDPLPPADEDQYALQEQQQYDEADQECDATWRQRQHYASDVRGSEQLGAADEGAALEGQA